ncbi:hypothetical protein LTR56_001493 [Elasticomyces elasticus]|nr:hypothetical protein LTR56_001493 [Elasticomyces elasticus]KAK3668585.1 hypothetical protein LTR22_000472 [Elasticomyces elasticus]KAK4931937.1 hypothetical protein LTR49_001624 [Elasticomyces elasticus]KAK5768532.1 hypothetical protein LTS12_001320 [Elasticomyces elasticus]
MYECWTCDDRFYDQDDCEAHIYDYGHWPECNVCDQTFKTQRACNQHMDAKDHWQPKHPCETCDMVFRSEQAVEQHMAAKGHWRNYCADCDKHFQNLNNYQAHRKSRVHQGATVPCPFCKTNYTTASGLGHHLETGSCVKAPGLNRDTIHRIISARDPHGTITNKQITYHQDDAPTTYSATNQAFNGRFWECYLCSRQFNSKTALNQHLTSPVHQQKVYHCFGRGCPKEFTSLAGFFNHLESETCGAMRFQDVGKSVGRVLGGNGLISFG